MPWKVEKKGNSYVVKNKNTGRVAGTHKSKNKAIAQLRALYSNVKN